MKKIAVIGSINIDFFVEVDSSPKPGETKLGNSFFRGLGGKGANQAVAASRLGAEVSFFGSVGNDENGKYVIDTLRQEKVNTMFLNTTDTNTGVAFIEITHAENRIVVVSGANNYTNVSYIKNILREMLEHDIFVFQLEVPMETLEYLIPILHKEGKVIVVNPAPALYIRKELIDKINYLTPNEHEYRVVLKTAAEMDKVLSEFPNKLMITCGKKGVKFFDGKKIFHVPAYAVEAVDTTGAGDTFCGAFVTALADGKTLIECVSFGNKAAALSVLKKGAQKGMPYQEEIEHFYEKELSPDGEWHIQTN
ncbi:ribokinase [Planococcus faecalis]|uniref:ribokinase n=1 Tax=Planococcus faecalis TaxID=1598147 RepID=UPI0008DA9AA9|nr:ribokinase [Planococcus faecalis]OHX51635.1 ribokinase [Planococcus faecalis]